MTEYAHVIAVGAFSPEELQEKIANRHILDGPFTRELPQTYNGELSTVTQWYAYVQPEADA